MKRVAVFVLIAVSCTLCQSGKFESMSSMGGIDLAFYQLTLDMEDSADLTCFGCELTGNLRIFSLSSPRYLADILFPADDSIIIVIFEFDSNLVVVEKTSHMLKTRDVRRFVDAVKRNNVPHLTSVLDPTSFDEKLGYVIKNSCYYVNQFYFPSQATRHSKTHFSFLDFFAKLMEKYGVALGVK